MEYIDIQGTSLQVSRIALGTWSIGGWLWGGTDKAQADATIERALDLGINLIDTAPVYGLGSAEELVGKVIKRYNRDRFVISTKAGLEWSGEPTKVVRNSSTPRLQQELDDSLRRLQTDFIDIYHIHWPDTRVPHAEVAAFIQKQLQSGKIRAVGLSNYSVEQLQDFDALCPVNVVQPPYNLFERDIEEALLPLCKEKGWTTLTYSPLCRGLLSGRMTIETQFPAGDLRRIDPKFSALMLPQYLKAVNDIDAWAQKEYGKSVTHLAARWLLDQPQVHVVLWGARKPEHLDAIDAILGWALDEKAIKTLETFVNAAVKTPVRMGVMPPPMRTAQQSV